MKRLILTLILLPVLMAVNGCTNRPPAGTGVPATLISLAPSITETLFALGLGEKVTGVTGHCKYPPMTAQIEKIGGYADPNLEKIISLKPDLVLLLREHEKQLIYLERFGIRTLTINNSSVAGVCSSFVAIGKACGVSDAADSLLNLFQTAMAKPDDSTGVSPRILFSVGRDSQGGGRVRSLYSAGVSTIYNELITAAGGQNVFRDSLPEYPHLSAEGIITLAPEIIIDIAPSMLNYECGSLANDWNNLFMVPAVKSGHIYCLSQDYATIPGPRILYLLDDIKKVILDFGKSQ